MRGGEVDMSDPLAPARGIVVCFLIGVALWAVIISLWAVLHG
jgi:hypothetical protein